MLAAHRPCGLHLPPVLAVNFSHEAPFQPLTRSLHPICVVHTGDVGNVGSAQPVVLVPGQMKVGMPLVHVWHGWFQPPITSWQHTLKPVAGPLQRGAAIGQSVSIAHDAPGGTQRPCKLHWPPIVHVWLPDVKQISEIASDVDTAALMTHLDVSRQPPSHSVRGAVLMICVASAVGGLSHRLVLADVEQSPDGKQKLAGSVL